MATQIFESKLAGSFLLCLLISNLGLFDCAPDAPTEIQGSGEEYLFIMMAAYKSEIAKLASKITQVETSFNKQLALLELDLELSTKIAQKAIARLRARGTLNIQGKMCVQNLVAKVTTENKGLQTKLRTCVDTARNAAKALPDPAKTQAQHTRNQLGFAVDELPVCQKDAGNNAQKLADCVWNKWKAREPICINHLKTGNKDIDDAAYKIETLVKVAQECSFNHILESQKLVAGIVTSFNLCVGDKTIDL